ncbi:MAG: hypothetical protein IJ719_07230 [Clostridia bacterium]|nr:hypothetical protein [Clostridia bacterium]
MKHMRNGLRSLQRAAGIVILVCIMLATCIGAAEQGSGERMISYAGSWEDEVSKRASMDATQDGTHVEILVHWGGSAFSAATWQISGEMDPMTGNLTYSSSKYTISEWDEEGNETIIDEQTSSGAFLWQGEKLRWQDSLNTDEGLFVKLSDAYEPDFDAPAPVEAPPAEELREGYCNILVNLEHESAGAALKRAVAASEVCAFAEKHSLYNPDAGQLQSNLIIAFEGLDDHDKAAFLEGFGAVQALLDDCLKDYEANRSLFEDAGVAMSMDMIMDDPLDRLAWENLRDYTLRVLRLENVSVDYGVSELYSQEELKEAAIKVKSRFASFVGCELHSLRYAGDACNTAENLTWMNRLDEGKGYAEVAEFISDFHSPTQPEEDTAWEPDAEYTDYQWWLARSAEGSWQLLTWGYQ